MVLDGIPGLPGIFCVSFYDTKPINFLLMCCKNIKCIQKTQKVYDPGKKLYVMLIFYIWMLMIHTMVHLSDQLWNVYQVDHWMRKYNWWWYLLFWGHDLILVNA